MKWFYHSEKDAVALCKSCNRALCMDCVADVPPGVACKGKCERDVADLNVVIERGKTGYQKAGKAYRRNSVAMLIMGLLFVVLGILPVIMGQGYGTLFLAVMGPVFLLWSFFSYRSGKQISAVETPSDQGGPANMARPHC